MPTPKTSVVIVAYKSASMLRAAVEPLLVDEAVGDILVVDNSRQAAAEEVVQQYAQRVRYIAPKSNLGFARGCALGVELTKDPILTFLNADVVLLRDLQPLVDLCGTGNVVAAGALVRSPLDLLASNARHPVTLWLEAKRAILGSAVSRLRLPIMHGTTPVAQVDGALLSISREFYLALGGFDDRFELYFEDVDLCDRARARGTVVLDRRTYGVHQGGGSSEQVSQKSYCVFRVSRVRYARKRFGRWGALAVSFITVMESVVRSLTRQSEGNRARGLALRLVLREVLKPGSVQVLQ